MWYNDLSGTMVSPEQVEHEMFMFYKEKFEDN
jgi:hypothetical protein